MVQDLDPLASACQLLRTAPAISNSQPWSTFDKLAAGDSWLDLTMPTKHWGSHTIDISWCICQARATWITCFCHTRSGVCKELEWQSLCSVGPMQKHKMVHKHKKEEQENFKWMLTIFHHCKTSAAISCLVPGKATRKTKCRFQDWYRRLQSACSSTNSVAPAKRASQNVACCTNTPLQ